MPVDRRSLVRGSALVALVPHSARAALAPVPEFWPALVEALVDCDASDLIAAHPESQGLAVAQVAARLQGFLAREPEALRDMLYAGVALLRYSSWWSGYPGHFEQLPLHQRRRMVRSWLASGLWPIQSLAMSLRSATLFLWFSDPAAWAAIGYTGPWVPREGLQP